MTGRVFRMVLVWLLIAAGGWSPVLKAQEAQDGQVPPAPPASEAKAPPASEAKAPPASEANEEEVEEAVGDTEASPAVFIPTEEISEDAAVPFPVDI